MTTGACYILCLHCAGLIVMKWQIFASRHLAQFRQLLPRVLMSSAVFQTLGPEMLSFYLDTRNCPAPASIDSLLFPQT